MTVDPVVRPATLDELDQLRAIETESRDALVSQRGGPRWLETHPAQGDSWPRLITAGSVHVAVIDEVVVGYIVVTSAGTVARIDDVYVTPDAREVGFGDALVESAVAQARSMGCASIEGEALPGDRETKNLYERAGITARLIIVSRSLPVVGDQ